MGAKQSKRSVDISGKEAESAGEVAAAGAGGEGRVEAIADADTLKPTVNGDAPHIQTPDEKTDKEKQLEIGTPEIEKDVTTEKESKEPEEVASPTVNGDDSKVEGEKENGESAPTPEEGKKPKKEKVKKKWSLRSISFSRKDKPKQEKKQKDEEPKTNGEAEKLPEEAAEATAESVEIKTPAEATNDTEIKEEKIPETPVTEPVTNGSSTPETPKVESPVVEVTAPTPELSATTVIEVSKTPIPEVKAPAPEVSAPAPEVSASAPEASKPALEVSLPVERPVSKTETEPEQLPVNGLSLEEPKMDVPEVPEIPESKPVEIAALTEKLPEIPNKEVCVEQMPLIESTPPPLPANPPPSSVASFAATTMAPELTDALVNTAESAIIAPLAATETEAIAHIESQIPTNLTNVAAIPDALKPSETIDIPADIIEPLANENKETEPPVVSVNILENLDLDIHAQSLVKNKSNVPSAMSQEPEGNIILETVQGPAAVPEKPEAIPEVVPVVIDAGEIHTVIDTITGTTNSIIEEVTAPVANVMESLVDILAKQTESLVETVTEESKALVDNVIEESEAVVDKVTVEKQTVADNVTDEINLEDKTDNFNSDESKIKKPVVKSNHITETAAEVNGTQQVNGNVDETEKQNLKNKAKDALDNTQEVECNGNIEESTKKSADAIEDVKFIDPVTPEESIASLSELNDVLPPPVASEDISQLADETQGSNEASESFPLPPSELCPTESEVSPAASPEPPSEAPQELLPVHDKIADLIPEVPEIPTETSVLLETASDVAVAN